MKKFRFHLESYLKLKKVREQQKLGELAKVMSRVNVFRAQQQAFEDEYNHLLQQQRAKFMRESLPIENVREMYEYLGALRQRRDTATRNIAQLEGEVSEKRNAYNAARKDRRVIEILKEKRLTEHRAATEREEIALMDEFNGARGRHNSLLWREAGSEKQQEQV
ncbi:MAG: flagellar export protein FliJ [Spirochaetota bacterium]